MQGFEHCGFTIAAVAAKQHASPRDFGGEGLGKLRQVFLYEIVEPGLLVTFQHYLRIMLSQQVQCCLR